ncbi:MAG: aldo/keto reductase family protein [Actinomycetota bacterium]|nr:aldo/keto reductase family protein [Actinomycetota bacterium]
MRYVALGESGLKVSVLCFGSWLTVAGTVSDGVIRRCVELALDAGVNLIDTADVYQSGGAEQVLGELLAGHERRHLVVATKAYFPMSDDPNDRGLSRKHLTESIDASLRRLRTDYVDLYQCHRYDEETPTEELVRTMGDLIAAGKVLYWGLSYWPPARIVEACLLADALSVPRPISNQPPYSLLERDIERRILPICREYGLDQIVFSPLAQGVLTGKYRAGDIPSDSRAASAGRRFMGRLLDEDTLGKVERFTAIAGEVGVTSAQLALAWVLHTEGVAAAIFGATRPEHVEENVAAAELRLDQDMLERLDELFPPEEGA